MIRRVSDVLTEYAMPLWKGELGAYVECDHCGDAFHPSILHAAGARTERDHAAFRTLIVGIMVSMMDSDGSAHSLELQAIDAIYSELLGGTVPPSVFKQGVDLARVAGADGAITLAENFNSSLNQLSRELVFRSALYISAADHVLKQSEMDFLERVGQALGLGRGHMKAIIRSAEDAGHVVLGGKA